jgi:2-aminobenzoate-CoA ligase
VLRPDVPATDDTAKALQEHVKSEIAPYKYPRAVAFVTELPKTHTGKLQRFALRQTAQAPVQQTAAAE